MNRRAFFKRSAGVVAAAAAAPFIEQIEVEAVQPAALPTPIGRYAGGAMFKTFEIEPGQRFQIGDLVELNTSGRIQKANGSGPIMGAFLRAVEETALIQTQGPVPMMLGSN